MVLYMGIGEKLREAREAHGYTLDDIQEKTKIQKRYLQAIEAERFEVLPGKFYARAFMKEYALTVGLDPNVLLADFSEADLPVEEETVQYTRVERPKRVSESKSSALLSFLPTVIVVLLIIGIVFIGITLYKQANDKKDGLGDNTNTGDEIIRDVEKGNNNTNDPDAGNNDTNENDEGEDEEQEPENPTSSFEVVTVGDGNVPHSEVNFLHPEDPIVISFEPTADTYVDVEDVNGNWLFIDTVAGGTTEEVDVTGQERVLFNVYGVKTMKIFINGVELEYPADLENTHQKIWVNFVTE